MFPRSQASRDGPRPVGGWFAFCLEDVGDNLEKTYGLDWSEVKMSMPRIQWRQSLQSAKQLHCK
ncbi:hypothetical protein ARMGADRAFT_529221 [Armillaria gallica]|uniref:Uncharacterized protein n=1 Tax=Armillaria gallica TaxID=47427 RepID=A0A2H3CXD4_ARMGA|nr:hypothetical protein ARMGADRAFT_529221 [Armillaria gallica]